MKIRFYLTMAVATLVMTNCSQEENLVQAPNGSKVINATIEGTSRSTVTDAGIFSWASGDAISVHDATNYNVYNYTGNGNGFTLNEETSSVTSPVVAYYPASESHTTTSFYLPNSYGSTADEYVANTHASMIATPPASGNEYAFMHLGGVMRFNVKNVPAGADAFQFIAYKNIYGSFVVKDNNGVKTIETTDGQNNTVNIYFKASNEVRDMTFYVPMPVGEYGVYTVGLRINNVIKSNTSQNVTNTINRKTLLLMPTFTYDATTDKLEKSTAKVGVIDLEEGDKEVSIEANADVVVTPGTEADATATLNYKPAQDGTSSLSISDGSDSTTSGESQGKVVVSTSEENATIASCDINTPSLTVELSATEGTEVTYTEVTALTADQTLIIGEGVTIEKLTINKGNVVLKGGKVKNISSKVATTITLEEDIELDAAMIISGNPETGTTPVEIVLDLNGHNITNSNAIYEQGVASSLITATGESTKLTIKDSSESQIGEIQEAGHDDYAAEVRDGATLTIESGSFIGSCTSVYALSGTVEILGGNFSINEPKSDDEYGYNYVLNLYNNGTSGGRISVKGGTFHNFDPAQNKAENPVKSFVADGYLSYPSTENVWTVVKKENEMEVSTAAQLNAVLCQGGKAKLTDDITLSKAITIPTGVSATINLNGYDITAPTTDAFEVAGTLTINDDNNEGVVTAGSARPNASVCAVWANGGTVTINGGHYKVHADQAGERNDCIYAGHNADNDNTAGNITINGGKFEYVWPEGEKNYDIDYNGDRFLLNCANSDESETKITVNGGEFKNHVPSYEDTGRENEVELGNNKVVKYGTTPQSTSHTKESGDVWYTVTMKSGVW